MLYERRLNRALTESKTITQSLRSLGNINAVKGPIFYSRNLLYKLKSNGESIEIKEEINDSLDNLIYLINSMIDIIKIENKSKIDQLDNWLTKNNDNNFISKTDVMLGLYKLFPEKENRSRWIREIIPIKKRLYKIKNNKHSHTDIDVSIKYLNSLLESFNKTLEPEKKLYDKIIKAKYTVI